MTAFFWVCNACKRPVSVQVEATLRDDGVWAVYAGLPIRIHMKQHKGT